MVAEIGAGLLVLVGVGHGDDEADAAWLAGKVLHLRIFEDDDGKMNQSVAEAGGDILVVPQFTLYGDARKGRRPSWAAAAPPEQAQRLVRSFAHALASMGASVREGAFQEHMEVELVNDGPVTILLESPAGRKGRAVEGARA